MVEFATDILKKLAMIANEDCLLLATSKQTEQKINVETENEKKA